MEFQQHKLTINDSIHRDLNKFDTVSLLYLQRGVLINKFNIRWDFIYFSYF